MFAGEETDYVKEIKLSLMRLQTSTFARFTQRAAVILSMPMFFYLFFSSLKDTIHLSLNYDFAIFRKFFIKNSQDLLFSLPLSPIFLSFF